MNYDAIGVLNILFKGPPFWNRHFGFHFNGFNVHF